MKNCLVVGMARSGVALANMLLDNGYNVICSDTKGRENFGDDMDELEKKGAYLALGEAPDAYFDKCDTMIISPGISINAGFVKRAMEKGVEVSGELEIGFRFLKGLVLAITGTNGKTTTTTLVGEIFKNCGKTTYVVGNIGIPVTSIADKTDEDSVTVIEVSSFQMETADEFYPKCAALLNITEDHLNRHGTMDEYIRMKKRVFSRQNESDFAVLNLEDSEVVKRSLDIKAKKLWFSKKPMEEDGAFQKEGNVYFRLNGKLTYVCKASDIYIPGPHNLENALAAVAMTMAVGVPEDIVAHTLKTFTGVEHRIETVDTISGIRYINDSKGTNVDSTVRAVQTMTEPTVILLGGSDKHTDFTPLCELIRDSENIRFAVTLGDTAKQFNETFDKVGFENYVYADGFENAVLKARELCKEGWNVLLSPACASFDMFKDYEQRGRVFKDIVMKIKQTML